MRPLNQFSHFAAGDDKNKREGKEMEGMGRHKKSQNCSILRNPHSELILDKFCISSVMTDRTKGVRDIRGFKIWHLPLKWLVTGHAVDQRYCNSLLHSL